MPVKIGYFFDKFLLILASILYLGCMILGAFLFEKIFPNIDIAFYFLSFGYGFIVFWGILSMDLKRKKGKELVLGLVIMIILTSSIVFLLLFIAYYFKIKFPDKGGAWYSALIGIPMIFLSMVIFDIIYRKAFKIFFNNKKNTK